MVKGVVHPEILFNMAWQLKLKCGQRVFFFQNCSALCSEINLPIRIKLTVYLYCVENLKNLLQRQLTRRGISYSAVHNGKYNFLEQP